MSVFRSLVFLPLMLVLSACAGNDAANKLPQAPMELPSVRSIPKELPTYEIQIGDVLELKMLLNPELEEEVTVRPDGKISTAVAQNITAYGLTPAELQTKLNEEYEQHLSNPNVAVIVRSFAPKRFYVMGEVQNPGEYVYVGPDITLLQALAMAGDVINSANTEQIIIMRRASENGQNTQQAFVADYENATDGLMPEANVPLAPYDVVYVPRTAVAETYVIYEQAIEQFFSPFFGIGFGFSLNSD